MLNTTQDTPAMCIACKEVGILQACNEFFNNNKFCIHVFMDDLQGSDPGAQLRRSFAREIVVKRLRQAD